MDAKTTGPSQLEQVRELDQQLLLRVVGDEILIVGRAVVDDVQVGQRT